MPLRLWARARATGYQSAPRKVAKMDKKKSRYDYVEGDECSHRDTTQKRVEKKTEP